MWLGGTLPGAADTATIAAPGAYAISLTGQVQLAGLTLSAPGAWLGVTGQLALGGNLQLAAGTLAIAGGTISGLGTVGTLSLAGGTLVAAGGALSNIAVSGVLDLSAPLAALVLRGGVRFLPPAAALSGARPAALGQGSITLTGSYASLTALGTQSLDAVAIRLGTPGGGINAGAAVLGVAAGPSGAGTLSLGSQAAIAQSSGQAVLQVGAALLPGMLSADQMIQGGSVTLTGGMLTVQGSGSFTNTGSISVSGGATLAVASAGFTNSGTISLRNACLALGGEFAASRIAALGNVSLAQSVLLLSGTADNRGGTLSLGSAVAGSALSLAGTILGGTVLDGGALSFAPGTGVLDGMLYRGVLRLGDAAAVTLANGTQLAAANPIAGGTASGGGSASITGAGAGLLLRGTATLDRATITLGNSQAASFLATSSSFAAATGSTITLGPALLVQQSGALAAILANGSTPVPGMGAADTLINQGCISGAIAGGTLSLGGVGNIINAGTITMAAGETLAVSANGFANTGLLAISGGACAVLGGTARPGLALPSWSNTGSIQLNAGTLVLGGSCNTAGLGRIAADQQSSVVISGVLNNSFSTLSLGAGASLPACTLLGTIAGGSIADPSGLLRAAPGARAVLDGVTYLGTLSLDQQYAALRIRNGITAPAIAITGAGAAMIFAASQVIDATRISLGSNGGISAGIDVQRDATPASAQAATLTLGAGVSVTQSGLLASIGGSAQQPGDGIVNRGMITTSLSAATLTLGGQSFVNQGSIAASNGATLCLAAGMFSNQGNVTLNGAGLLVAGTLATSVLQGFSLSGAWLAVSGVLDNANATLAIGNGTSLGRLTLSGVLRGGVISDAGQGLTALGGAALAQLSYWGTLDLSRPFSQLALAGGVSLAGAGGSGAGAVMLTGAAARLTAQTSQTIDGATIYCGNAGTFYLGQRLAAPCLAAAAGATLTLGKSLLLRTAGLQAALGDAAAGQFRDTIINAGQILAASPNGTLNIAATNFINLGGFAIGQGGNVSASGVNFTNAGNISLVAGSGFAISLANYYAAPNAQASPFTNAGTLRMLGGALAETLAGGIFPPVAIINQPGGLIQGVGTINAPVQNLGLIEAKYGLLWLQQGLAGNGIAQIAPGTASQGNTLQITGAVAAAAQLRFTGANETVRLDQPAQVSGSIGGFAAGNQIILTGTVLSGLSLNGAQMVFTATAGTGSTTLRLPTTAALSGVLAAAGNGRGDTLVSFTQAPPGASGAAGAAGAGNGTLNVAALGGATLYWAGAPCPTLFTGTAANLAGDRIGNFSSLCRLDITDIAPAAARLAYAQGNGAGLLSIGDGQKAAAITLPGTFSAAGFTLGPDGQGAA